MRARLLRARASSTSPRPRTRGFRTTPKRDSFGAVSGTLQGGMKEVRRVIDGRDCIRGAPDSVVLGPQVSPTATMHGGQRSKMVEVNLT